MSAAELLLHDEDEDVRAWAEAALNRLRAPVAPSQAQPAALQAVQPAPSQAAVQKREDSASSALDLLQDDDDDVRAWAEVALRQGRASAAHRRGSPSAATKPSTPLTGAPLSSGDGQLGTAGSLSFAVAAPVAESVEETQSDVISVCVRCRGLNAAERPGGTAWKMDGSLIWEAEAEVCLGAVLNAVLLFARDHEELHTLALLTHWHPSAQAEAEMTGQDITAYEFPKVFSPSSTQVRSCPCMYCPFAMFVSVLCCGRRAEEGGA